MRNTSVEKRADLIKKKLESIMDQSFRQCKSSNPETASLAREVNTLAHECSLDMDKLISEHRRREWKPKL